MQMSYARRKGLEEGERRGREEGREEGLIQGMEKGREEGEKRKALQIARAMRSMGLAVEAIVQATGLNSEDIKGLN